MVRMMGKYRHRVRGYVRRSPTGKRVRVRSYLRRNPRRRKRRRKRRR